MKKLRLSSKAKTLEELQEAVRQSEVLPVYRFFAMDYDKYKSEILINILSQFKTNLIVRSSSFNEDNFKTSNAGGFDSVLNVNISSRYEIDEAIKKVISSYGVTIDCRDEVFIQPMLSDVKMSGVIFTVDIDTMSSYYIVNYDENGSTCSVTSGQSNDLKTFVCLKGYNKVKDERLARLIIASKECEKIFDNKMLDIEFAFTDKKLYILQVRAIVLGDKEDLSNMNLLESLKKLHKKIEKLNAIHPNLLGKRTIFGVMTDWNPAEIIGIRPKRLALSLYKELITDETWAFQRDNYGYRNLRSHPLLVSFLGIPFIDVRISFNSFIPKCLNENIATKLVDYYLDELSKNINHHDKVEFEIIYSCYYFGVENKLNKLKNFDFRDSEINNIKESLLVLTNKVIDVEKGLYKIDLEKIDILKIKYSDVVNSKLSLIDKIYWLIKDVRRYGTLPFAGIARAGFIAVQFLKSFVDEKIISKDEYESFLNSLSTVSKELSRDIHYLSKDKFLEIYGHLRPGTYDITSLRYDEAYDLYFGSNKTQYNDSEVSFSFSNSQKEKIEKLIVKNGLNTTFDNLIIFIKEAIEGREYAKFEFTKSLSQILKYIEVFGKRYGFSRDELAYLDIQEIINLYATLDHRDVREILRVDVNKNKEFYQYVKAVKLPSVIVSHEDIYTFFLEDNESNFVTLNRVEALVVIEENIADSIISGKIICIKSADPGYDYLFSKNIAGLITCYGGANSHMSIRCAEMGIPAVIGCGENNFSQYCKAQYIEIDALNKQVKVLS